MDISHLYNLSIKKRDKILFQCKSDDIRKFTLVKKLITKCIEIKISENNKKEEEKWLETCLDKLNQLKLNNY
jgi:hypothetical protein